jgi:phage terminase large subunit
LTNPKLSSQALEDIEIIKERNIQEYNWNYLGIPTGGGVVPFDNLVFRPITEEEIKSFDNIRQGIDWGYASDPFCFGRMHYDKTRRKLYFLDEIYGVKLSNREVAGKILSKGYQDIVTIADSAEPKSIAELKEYGVRIIPAKKGQGSVEYGEKWLDDLTEIIIDPVRTPNIATEFENIDYVVDRFGQTQPKLEDKDNHSIDMSRYACENDMNKEGFYSLRNKII